ncbi:MAG: hypothetical protein ABIN37_14720, partial [Burkholderiaceae bacterium]
MAAPVRGHLVPVGPEALEWLFTLATIAFLIWQSAAFRDAGFVRGVGDRYQEAVELKVPISPQAAGTRRVVEICNRYGGLLPDAERDLSAQRNGVCHSDARHPIVATSAAIFTDTRSSAAAEFAALARQYEALAQSLALPVKARLSELQELDNRAREARTETDVQGAIQNLAGETRLYRDAYGITGAGTRSLPVECAWNYLDARFHLPARDPAPDAFNAAQLYPLLGMAALLDGDPARALAAVFPASDGQGGSWSKVERGADCAALGQPRQVMGSAAEIVSRARASENDAAKALAMQELLFNAYWIYASWAVAGLALLQIGRRALPPGRFLPLAVLTWAVLGWSTHVHLEWISDRAAQTAWLLRWGVKWPD